MADRPVAELEIHASDPGPRIRATLIQERRASTSTRRELFAPGAAHWAAEGVELRTEHLGRAETRVVPTRKAGSRIVIEAPATPALFAAVPPRQALRVRRILRAWRNGQRRPASATASARRPGAGAPVRSASVLADLDAEQIVVLCATVPKVERSADEVLRLSRPPPTD